MSMSLDRALGQMGAEVSSMPMAPAVQAVKVVVETKKQKEARLAAEKDAKKRAKIAAAVAGNAEPKKKEKKKAETPAASAEAAPAAAPPASAAASSATAADPPVSVSDASPSDGPTQKAPPAKPAVKTYTEAERKRAIKHERARAEAAERAFSTAYECHSTHRPIDRAAVEYYVRGAAELEEAGKEREAVAAKAAAAQTERKAAELAKAAASKKGCQVSFEEWGLLRLAAGQAVSAA